MYAWVLWNISNLVIWVVLGIVMEFRFELRVKQRLWWIKTKSFLRFGACSKYNWIRWEVRRWTIQTDCQIKIPRVMLILQTPCIQYTEIYHYKSTGCMSQNRTLMITSEFLPVYKWHSNIYNNHDLVRK